MIFKIIHFRLSRFIKMKITSVLMIAFICALPMMSFGQMLGPVDPGGGPIGGDVPIGGGAPIGGGSIILMGLAAAYGGRKIYLMKKESLEE